MQLNPIHKKGPQSFFNFLQFLSFYLQVCFSMYDPCLPDSMNGLIVLFFCKNINEKSGEVDKLGIYLV